MSHRINRTMVACAIAGVLGSALTGASAAQADPHETTAEGHIGSVNVVLEGRPVNRAPIAPCDVADDQENSSGTVNVSDAATYWGGTTACTWDTSDEAHARITGRYFSTRVLEEWGGPRIKVSSFKVNCQTRANGSSGNIQLTGLRGIRVPETIPPNYTVTIPGRIEGAAPLAKVIVNELVTPQPSDGSMRVNGLHIKLFPEGGPSSGDIIVGSVTCDPYGG